MSATAPSGTPWVIAIRQPWGLVCDRCRQQMLIVGVMISISAYLEEIHEFCDRHADCRPTAELVRAAGGVELPGFEVKP